MLTRTGLRLIRRMPAAVCGDRLSRQRGEVRLLGIDDTFGQRSRQADDHTHRFRLWRLCLHGVAVLATCAGLATCCPIAHADQDSVLMRGRHDANDASRVSITLEVNGSLEQAEMTAAEVDTEAPSAKTAGKTMEFPLRVAGRLMYDEVLRGGRDEDALSTQSVRYYQHAAADIRVGEHTDQIELDDDRRIMTATGVDQPLLCCLDGPLTREELDLIDVPGSSLLVDRMLPNRNVRVGDQWKADRKILAELVHWSEVSEGEVTCGLKQVVNGLAIVSLSGSLAGTADAAESSLKLSGELRYDVHWRRITWLRFDMKERRGSGLVQPGFNVHAVLRMRVQPVEHAPQLTARIRAAAWQANPRSQSLLLLRPRATAFEMTHDRRWHLTGDFPRRLVMRCLDEGKLLAQLNVSELAKLPAGRELSLEDFQIEIRDSLGDQFQEFLSATKDQIGGYRVLRVVAVGTVADVPIHWIYYHVSDPTGRRAAHVYVLESENIERFAGADHEMLAGFRFALPAAIEDQNSQAQVPSSPVR